MNDEKEGCYLITNDKKSIPLKAQGWDAYIKRP
jgi:hypothetical protein